MGLLHSDPFGQPALGHLSSSSLSCTFALPPQKTLLDPSAAAVYRSLRLLRGSGDPAELRRARVAGFGAGVHGACASAFIKGTPGGNRQRAGVAARFPPSGRAPGPGAAAGASRLGTAPPGTPWSTEQVGPRHGRSWGLSPTPVSFPRPSEEPRPLLSGAGWQLKPTSPHSCGGQRDGSKSSQQLREVRVTYCRERSSGLSVKRGDHSRLCPLSPLVLLSGGEASGAAPQNLPETWCGPEELRPNPVHCVTLLGCGKD